MRRRVTEAGPLRFFNVYQYLAPAVLVPAATFAWWWHFDRDPRLALAALLVPVLASYVIAGVGTNVLRLWRFHSRLKWGEFRPHHGFLLGSATSLLAWLATPAAPRDTSWTAILGFALVVGSVVGFWNWLYDLHAIKAGFIEVFNRPWAAGQGAEAIASDYAPVFFGAFGLAYGVYLQALEHWRAAAVPPAPLWVVSGLGLVSVIAVSVGAHVLAAYRRYGDFGLRPCAAAKTSDQPDSGLSASAFTSPGR